MGNFSSRLVPLRAFFISPVTLGLVATVAFYRSLDVWPWQRELAQRYFCGHPLEYVTTTLFFIALASLVLKAVQLSRERRVLRLSNSVQSIAPETAEPVARAERLRSWVDERGEPVRSSLLGRRIRDMCEFVVGRRSPDGLEEHLKYLGELAAEQSHRSYALVRTITWAVPILGFLGTVVGITLAVAKVTPEQLDTSLSQVTSGLAVAFDTTALALTLSLVLVFGSFLVERSEQKLLAEIEDFAVRRLLRLFPAKPATIGCQLLDAEGSCVEMLLSGTQRLIEQQARAWSEGLEGFRQRWLQDAERQRERLQNGLTEGFSTSVGQLSSSLTQLAEQAAKSAHSTQQGLKRSLEQWQTELRQNGQWLQQLQVQLAQQAELLVALTEKTDQLNRLQKTLDRNLQSVRAAEMLEQTLHSLTAAVHLLTARAQAIAESGSAKQSAAAGAVCGERSVTARLDAAASPLDQPDNDTGKRAA